MKWLLILTICFIIFYFHNCSMEFRDDDYIVNTNKCRIPNIPPYSPKLIFQRNATIRCSNYPQLISFTSTVNGVSRLAIRQDLVRQYFGRPYSLNCCYSYVYRHGTDLFPDVGVVVSPCFPFYYYVELNHDLVWVSCSHSSDQSTTSFGFPSNPVYDNIHQIISVSDSVREKGTKLKEKLPRKPISVLIVVIDSVSRLNFIRTMPRTREFLLNNSFYEFLGYNKVADNTYPNAMAFLTGMNLEQSTDVCKPTEIEGLNNCPFIWKKYQDLGYATAYGEDWSQIATFNYLKKGFKNKPTDYYFKPYMDAITYLKTEIQDTMPFCSGPEIQGDRILNLAREFAFKLKDLPSFGVFWMNTFSHNEITAPRSMDNNVRNFFELLKSQNGILDESIVILLSDHGIRFGDIINTTRGFYELRLPMHYVSLPTWFKKTYPIETQYFEDNTKKLTSNYDLYMTLQHILKMTGATSLITPSTACPQCRSFFEKMPEDRSCLEAGIPDIWCTCNSNITLEDVD